MSRSLVWGHCSQALRLIKEYDSPIEVKDKIPGAPLLYDKSASYYKIQMVRSRRLVTYFSTALMNKDSEAMTNIAAELKGTKLWLFIKRHLNLDDIIDRAIARRFCVTLGTLKQNHGEEASKIKKEILEKVKSMTS